jgi:glycosyltransferase involved in cell wall biosynthesis
LTKKLGLERNVVFTGAVDQSTKEVYMKNCDVFCVSPRTESFGVVYLEAMSYGKPIVTTNVGGVPEVLGDVAILVPPDDSSSLANALITVLTEKTKAASFGTRGIQRAKQFNWEIIANKYEDLYRKLLNPQVESYNTQPTPLVPDIFPDQTETQLISSSKKQRKHK